MTVIMMNFNFYYSNHKYLHYLCIFFLLITLQITSFCIFVHTASRFVCGACSRLLTKSVKSVCLRACGHVICDPCRVRLVDKDPTCPDCAAGVVTSDIVALSTGAAGFASSGAAVASKRVRAAFH